MIAIGTNRLLAVLAAALALLASGCAIPGLGNSEPSGEWLEGEVDAPSGRVVRETVIVSLQRLAYPLGTGMDPVNQRAESGWSLQLAPFRGKGYRTKAEVEWEALEPGRYLVEVRVKKQMNDDIRQPTDPSYAKWKWTDDDEDAAKVLLQHILAAFAPELDVDGEKNDPTEGLKPGT